MSKWKKEKTNDAISFVETLPLWLCHNVSIILGEILDSGCFKEGYRNFGGGKNYIISLPEWFQKRFHDPLYWTTDVDNVTVSFFQIQSAWFWVPIIEAVKDRAVKGQAMIIIKRSWLRCRYDPEYEMCRQLVWGNYIRLKEEFQN